MFVTKFDGRKQEFRKEKVVRTCLRMRATRKQAYAIAEKIESKLYEGITTKEILKMIFRYIKDYRPEVRHEIDLREAISLLRPKPDFEVFVQLLLKAVGYDVDPNQLLRGRCVEHEIDAVAKKGDETILVEVKHHYNHHTYTGMDVCMVARSRLEDLNDGFKLGYNKINFNKIMIVCNTKFSGHALRYSKCKGITNIGWKAPVKHGLEQMVEEKKLYPITFLKDLDRESERKLGYSGVVLLKQLVETDIDKLCKMTRISRKKLSNLVEKAKKILSG
jgi:Holliday junction resolvase-like predicted endonuclease